MTASVFDDRVCTLGEGPLWHPEREALFWFDILERRMLSRDAGGVRDWTFDAQVSAAGWIARDTLLVASEHRLFRFDLTDGSSRTLCDLEADDPGTRSNDGRADPMGGFWIGTMGKGAEPGAGAIYRYHRGELRRLFADITIPNAICFAPTRDLAYFADSARRTVWRVELDAEGWPDADPSVFVDLSGGTTEPDGAVVDASGAVWISEWGGARIRAWSPAGACIATIPVDAAQPTCPAFGGPGLATLFCTSARTGLGADALSAHPHSGKTFAFRPGAHGQAEHRVVLA